MSNADAFAGDRTRIRVSLSEDGLFLLDELARKLGLDRKGTIEVVLRRVAGSYKITPPSEREEGPR